MNAPSFTPTRRDVADARLYARRLRAATRRVRHDPVPANLLARLNAKRRAGFGLDYFLNEYASWIDHNARAGLYRRAGA